MKAFTIVTLVMICTFSTAQSASEQESDVLDLLFGGLLGFGGDSEASASTDAETTTLEPTTTVPVTSATTDPETTSSVNANVSQTISTAIACKKYCFRNKYSGKYLKKCGSWTSESKQDICLTCRHQYNCGA